MAGIFPTSTGFTTTKFKINNPLQVSTTFGGKTRRVGLGTSYYSFTASFPPMPRAYAQQIIGFLASQYGMLDSFQIYLPNESWSSTGYTTAITTSSTVATGVKSIAISTSAANGTVILRAGDFFKFTGSAWAATTTYAVGRVVTYDGKDWSCAVAHTSASTFDGTKWVLQSKVYMVSQDVTVQSNSATIYFSGSATLPVTSGTTIRINQIPFTVILNNDVQEYEIGIDRMYKLEIDLRELL